MNVTPSSGATIGCNGRTITWEVEVDVDQNQMVFGFYHLATTMYIVFARWWWQCLSLEVDGLMDLRYRR